MTTQLANALRCTIEAWSDELRQSSGLLRLTREGRLPPSALALYLESLRYLFGESQKNLGRAAAVCRARGRDDLAAYFAAKAREERGHDQWARDDLSHLPSAARESRPSPGAVALAALQRELIEQEPLCFAAYALWAEYFTVLLGDEWLDALSHSGYTRAQLSAIARHVDADRAHAATSFGELERLWHGEPSLATMLAVVPRAGGLFAGLCDEVFTAALAVA